jgi:hypothetical protein
MPASIDHNEVQRLRGGERDLGRGAAGGGLRRRHITGELDRERPVIIYCNDYQ